MDLQVRQCHTAKAHIRRKSEKFNSTGHILSNHWIPEQPLSRPVHGKHALDPTKLLFQWPTVKTHSSID